MGQRAGMSPEGFESVETVDRPLVLVADSVWETWPQREAEFKKPSIALTLTPPYRPTRPSTRWARLGSGR